MKNKTSVKASNKDIIAITSAAFEDVWFGGDNEDSYTKFSVRVKAANNSKNPEVQELARKINEIKDTKELNSVMRSPAGLKTLLSIKSVSDLGAYCEILNFQMSELEELLSSAKTPVTHFSKSGIVTAFGVWTQNLLESEKNGEAISESQKSIASKAVASMVKLEAFRMGRKISFRVWNSVVTERKRGRRSTREINESFDFADTKFKK